LTAEKVAVLEAGFETQLRPDLAPGVSLQGLFV
jgi:hypothetical protein